MSRKEILKRMFEIKRKLLEIYRIYKYNLRYDINILLVIDEEIHNLYNEYLKLYILISKKIPDYNLEWPYLNSSCYYYAMNLPTPKIFEVVYEELTGYPFENHLGSIAGLPYLDNFNKEDILNYLYADLNALNIKYYKCDVDSINKHNGYKISLLVDETPGESDYHFIRQNSNGLWSEKDGCGCEVTNITTPSEFMSDPFYKYVCTLELVKGK